MKESLEVDKKLYISQVAIKLFAEYGFKSTSISMISKSAKVSQGLIYHYFKNKDDLLNFIVAQAISQFDNYFKLIDTIKSAKEKLRKIIDLSFGELTENREYWKLYFFVFIQPHTINTNKEYFEEFYNKTISFLVDLLKEIGIKNADSEARILAAMLDGLQLHLLIYDDLDRYLEDIKEKIFLRYNL